MALTRLARILTLVLALIVVAVLKILIAVVVVLTLIVIILMLDIASGICLRGAIAFSPGVQTTVCSDMSSVNWALFRSTRMFLLCWTGWCGRLLRFLIALRFGILSFLVFALFGFAVLLLPSAVRAVAIA